MPHFLYIGVSEDKVIAKIGRTEYPKTRIGSINAECRKRFGINMNLFAVWEIDADTIAEAKDEEQLILRRFESGVIHGSEWIYATPELIYLAESKGLRDQRACFKPKGVVTTVRVPVEMHIEAKAHLRKLDATFQEYLLEAIKRLIEVRRRAA